MGKGKRLSGAGDGSVADSELEVFHSFSMPLSLIFNVNRLGGISLILGPLISHLTVHLVELRWLGRGRPNYLSLPSEECVTFEVRRGINWRGLLEIVVYYITRRRSRRGGDGDTKRKRGRILSVQGTKGWVQLPDLSLHGTEIEGRNGRTQKEYGYRDRLQASHRGLLKRKESSPGRANANQEVNRASHRVCRDGTIRLSLKKKVREGKEENLFHKQTRKKVYSDCDSRR